MTCPNYNSDNIISKDSHVRTLDPNNKKYPKLMPKPRISYGYKIKVYTCNDCSHTWNEKI